MYRGLRAMTREIIYQSLGMNEIQPYRAHSKHYTSVFTDHRHERRAPHNSEQQRGAALPNPVTLFGYQVLIKEEVTSELSLPEQT